MNRQSESDKLSWGDTVFLHLEREDMPLNVASLCTFEGEVSLADCGRFVESKLPQLPRYLKRVVAAPFGLGLPSWQYDPEFELSRHIKEVTLQHGTETELKNLAGKLFSTAFDRKHPLWDMTLVHGLKGNRTGIIFRLHHCMVDGMAGVELMKVLLDATPDATLPPRQKMKFKAPLPPDPLSSLTAGFVDSYYDFIKTLLDACADLLSMAERTATNGAKINTKELATLFPEITAFTERLRFNVVYHGPQMFAATDIPLEEVKNIRHEAGASVNDVILAIITAALRTYCELHGDRVNGRLLRIMVPVNLRHSPGGEEWGNRISLIPVTIPFDIRDPRKLLAAVHRRTEFLKRVHAAELVSLAGGLIGMLPLSLQGLAGPIASQLPITPFNLVCTNVPGPQFPLYLLGHKMIDWYPYVPVGGEMAVNCAVLSYSGTVYFGFSGDVQAASDLRRVEKLLQASFRELRDAVIGQVRKKPVRHQSRRRATAVQAKISPPHSSAAQELAVPSKATKSERVAEVEPAPVGIHVGVA